MTSRNTIQCRRKRRNCQMSVLLNSVVTLNTSALSSQHFSVALSLAVTERCWISLQDCGAEIRILLDAVESVSLSHCVGRPYRGLPLYLVSFEESEPALNSAGESGALSQCAADVSSVSLQLLNAIHRRLCFEDALEVLTSWFKLTQPYGK